MPRFNSTEHKTTVEGAISDGFSELQSLGDEMREWADNLEEKFSSTSKYETVSSAADTLEGLSEPGVEGELGDLEVTYSTQHNARRGRGDSRSLRRDNGVAALSAARDRLQEWIDDRPEDEEEPDISDAESLVADLEEIISESEGVEFPGMFG